MEFRYDADWLAAADAFPMSLSLPLTEKAYRSDALLPVLDNMLPDEEGVRHAIAARVGAQGTDPFSLLWELGRDCVGALQFLPAGDDPSWSAEPVGEELSEEQLERLLTSLHTAPLGLGRDADFRISVAGAQEKTALLQVGSRWLRPKGTTPSSHIIKPSIGVRGELDLSRSVENEYVCMSITREMGLPTASVRMEHFGSIKALVVERFDRAWLGGGLVRLPQEDTCQSLSIPSFRKYEADGGPGMNDIFELLLQSDEPRDDRKRFLQACFAFWLLGATDGHAKNFSLSLGAQGGFRLAPLYDVMSLQPNVDAHQVRRRDHRLAMAVGTHRHYKIGDILPRHFVQSAAMAGVSEDTAMEWLWDVADRVFGALERVGLATKDEVPEELFSSIREGLASRAALVETV